VPDGATAAQPEAPAPAEIGDASALYITMFQDFRRRLNRAVRAGRPEDARAVLSEVAEFLRSAGAAPQSGGAAVRQLMEDIVRQAETSGVPSGPSTNGAGEISRGGHPTRVAAPPTPVTLAERLTQLGVARVPAEGAQPGGWIGASDETIAEFIRRG
jgi:hypothetical protein